MNTENKNLEVAADQNIIDVNSVPVVADANTSLADFDALNKALEGVDGVTLGDIGMKIARVPIDKYKASTQKIDRISFITKKVIGIKSHYIEGVGSILCFGKKCCELNGMPSVRYLFPVVVYATDGDGNVTNNKLELKILSVGEDMYKSIITINKATVGMGGIDNVDLLVTCTDDKYQKITLNQAGPAMWKKSKSAVQYVTEKWLQDGEFAYMAVARKVDEATMLELMGVESAGTANQPPQRIASNTDLQNYFND